MTPEWFSAIWTCVGAVATAAAVYVAYIQLGNLNDSVRMTALGLVLQLESEMNARKEKVDESATRVRLEAAREDSCELEIFTDAMKVCVENWINSADRLAFCILRGYLKERDWQSEYRDYFANLIQNHTEFFGPASIYTNLIDLNHKWKRA